MLHYVTLKLVAAFVYICRM